MVAPNQNLVTVQLVEYCVNCVSNPIVTKMVHYITLANNFVPVLNQCNLHFHYIGEGPLKLLAVAVTAEMGVRREKDIWHSLILLRVTWPMW